MSDNYIVKLTPLPNGQLGCIIPLAYGSARICVGPDHLFIDNSW